MINHSFEEVERFSLSGVLAIEPEIILEKIYLNSISKLDNSPWSQSAREVIFAREGRSPFSDPGKTPDWAAKWAKGVVNNIFLTIPQSRQSNYPTATSLKGLVESALIAGHFNRDEPLISAILEEVEREAIRGLLESWSIHIDGTKNIFDAIEDSVWDYACNEAALQVSMKVLERNPLVSFEYIFMERASVHEDLEVAQLLGKEMTTWFEKEILSWPDEHEMKTIIFRSLQGLKAESNKEIMEIEVRMAALLAAYFDPQALKLTAERTENRVLNSMIKKFYPSLSPR
jgi:hypothetical protein